jgi:hypothetical protein
VRDRTIIFTCPDSAFDDGSAEKKHADAEEADHPLIQADIPLEGEAPAKKLISSCPSPHVSVSADRSLFKTCESVCSTKKRPVRKDRPLEA